MRDELSIMRLFRGSRSEVFNYFVDPKLIEMWSAPDGMTLRVPHFEAKAGGTYRYEHTAGDGGVYVCEGYLKEFQPGSKLVMMDSVRAPDGKMMFQNLEGVITFSEKPGGTFVTVTQRGFPDERSLQECEQGWTQCFDKLDSLLSSSEQSASL